jgi:hypothetical protein
MDERRWCVATVSDAHQVPAEAPANHPNRLYWNALHAQTGSKAGKAAFLYAMLNRKLDGWKPVEGVPRTEALGEQKMEGLKGANRWWFERLRDGDLPAGSVIVKEGASIDEAKAWRTSDGLAVKPDDLVSDFASWTRAINLHTNVSHRGLLAGLKAWGVEGGDGIKERRQRCWRLPRLSRGRAIMAGRLGFDPF